MSVPQLDRAASNVCSIEVDRVRASELVLLTLTTSRSADGRPTVSSAALGSHEWLEELPEVLRVIGLALVFQDADAAHRAVWRLLEALATDQPRSLSR